MGFPHPWFVQKCWPCCVVFLLKCSSALDLSDTLHRVHTNYMGITDSNNCQKGNASCKSCPHVIWKSSDLSENSQSLENAWKKSFLQWPQQKVSMNWKIYVSLIKQCTQLLHGYLMFQELRPMDWVHLKSTASSSEQDTHRVHQWPRACQTSCAPGVDNIWDAAVPTCVLYNS